MRIQYLVSFAVAILAAGCQTIAPTYTLSATDTQNQTYKINPTTQRNFIVSRKRDSIVAVELSTERAWADYGQAFDIKVKNLGKRSVQFGGLDIAIVSDGQSSQVLDYAGMQRALVESQNAKEASAMFAAVAGGVGAGLYAGSRNANPALSSAITQTVATSVQASTVSLSNSKAESDVLSGESSKSFLTNVTIPPRATIGGIVVAPQIAGREAQITVTVGGDTHIFSIASQ